MLHMYGIMPWTKEIKFCVDAPNCGIEMFDFSAPVHAIYDDYVIECLTIFTTYFASNAES